MTSSCVQIQYGLLFTITVTFPSIPDCIPKGNQDLQGILTEAAEYLVRSDVDVTCKAHCAIVQAIQSCEVMVKLLQVVRRQYMEMIMDMLMFIRSVRTAD